MGDVMYRTWRGDIKANPLHVINGARGKLLDDDTIGSCFPPGAVEIVSHAL
jgi:hypothetical protein